MTVIKNVTYNNCTVIKFAKSKGIQVGDYNHLRQGAAVADPDLTEAALHQVLEKILLTLAGKARVVSSSKTMRNDDSGWEEGPLSGFEEGEEEGGEEEGEEVTYIIEEDPSDLRGSGLARVSSIQPSVKHEIVTHL